MRDRLPTGLTSASLLALASAACTPQLSLIDGGVHGDGGGVDASVDARDASTALAVSFVQPAAEAYTNGTITIQVAVAGVPVGASGLSVEILRDGQSLTTLTNALTYAWDTRGVPEGRHEIVARATYAGRAAMSDVRGVIVDRTPPSVLSRVPAPGSIDVSMRDPLNVTFSEPVLESTVTNASLQIAYPDPSGSPLTHTWSFSPDSSALSITLTGTTPAGFFPTTIAGTITGAVTDRAGNGLVAPTAWTWQVPDWASVARDIHAATGPGAVGSDLVVDAGPGGELLLAWAEGKQNAAPDDRLEIFVQRRVNGAWVPLGGAISAHPAAPRAQFPRLGVSATGARYVSWIEPEVVDPDGGVAADYLVHAARWDGAAWTEVAPGVSATPGGVTPKSPQAMALDPSGNPTVAWVETDASTGIASVYAARYNNGASSWAILGSPQRASGSSTGPQEPSLAYSRDGELYLAWSELEVLARNVYVRHLAPTASDWQPLATPDVPLQPSQLTGQTEAPSIALGPADEVIVAANAQDAGFGAHSVYVAQWDAMAGAWQPLGTLQGDTAASTDTAFPHLVLDGTGAPWVAWVESVSAGGMMTFVQHRHSDGTWQSVGAGLSAQRPTPAQRESLPRIALDPTGHAAVTWTQENLQDATLGAVYAAVQNY